MPKKQLHTTEQISSFMDELKKQTDRGAALIASAVLEEILTVLISARLLDVSRERHDALFGGGRPLEAFSAKIELGFALGIYNNAIRLQLDLIRDVRNKFAHRVEQLQFDHPDIAKMIESRRLKTLPTDVSLRNQFMGLFGMVGAILYGTAKADIRIKSLEETHATHFQRMMQAVGKLDAEAKAQTQDASPKPEMPKQ